MHSDLAFECHCAASTECFISMRAHDKSVVDFRPLLWHTMTYRIKRRYILCGFYTHTEIEQFKTFRLIVDFHLAIWVSAERMLCVLFVLADALRERPLWSACLLAVTMKYCWGHTRVWELLIQKSAYVTHSCGPCREKDGWKLPHWSGTVKRPHPRSIFSSMCLPPSHPLIFQDGNELGGGQQSTPLSSLLSVPV